MKLPRLSIILSLCLLMVFVLTGSVAAQDSARHTVVAAYKKLAEVKSYHMAMTGEMSTSVQGKYIHGTMDSQMDVFVQPLLAKNTIAITANVDGKQFNLPMVQYMERVDKRIFTYTYAEGKWDRQSLPGNDCNPARDLGVFIRAIKSAELISEDQGIAVYRVTADGKYLKDTIIRNLGTMGLKKGEITAMSEMFLNGMGSLTYNLTIDKNGGMISGMDMDLSELIAAIGNRMMDNLPLPENKNQEMLGLFNNTKMELSITLSQIDNIEPFAIPDEARGE